MYNKNVNLDKKCVEWLDKKPRVFNFSKWIRTIIHDEIYLEEKIDELANKLEFNGENTRYFDDRLNEISDPRKATRDVFIIAWVEEHKTHYVAGAISNRSFFKGDNKYEL